MSAVATGTSLEIFVVAAVVGVAAEVVAGSAETEAAAAAAAVAGKLPRFRKNTEVVQWYEAVT